MTWARLEHVTELKHSFSPFLPSDHWGQVDVWVPNLEPCSPSEILPWFFQIGTSGFVAMDGLGWGGDWGTFEGHHSSTNPLTAETAFTVGWHCTPVGGGYQLDFYVNGTLILTDTSLTGTLNALVLNGYPPFCCCQTVYYTNVLVGTSQGAGDLFSDDFSGGLDNWTVIPYYNTAPKLAATVASPSSDPCPTISLSKANGQVNTPITVTGSGFTPDSDLIAYVGGSALVPISSFSAVTDGSGSFSATVTIPYGIGSSSPGDDTFYIVDAAGLVACASFGSCGGKPADGIRSDVDSEGDSTNTPNPLVAFGGSYTGVSNPVLDYIWHDGAHWVLWADPSALTDVGPDTVNFNPIPANHTLNATRISADGSSVVDYPINTHYRYFIAAPPNAESILEQDDTICGGALHPTTILWDRVWWFTGWDKPIYEAKFASDGANLWVGVLTRESINYEYLSLQGGFDIDGVQASDPEGFAYQITRPPHIPGTTYDPVIRSNTGLLDFCYNTAYPLSDGGTANSGMWDPPRIRMFSFDGAGFNDIGTMDALYCPGLHDSPAGDCNYIANNAAGAGAFFSGFSLAASDAEPGVCHLVWSEGGDWGSYGLAGSDPSGCPCPLVWDGGPLNRDYRVGYSIWTPTAKASETNLWQSHIDRGLSLDAGGVSGFWFRYDFGGGVVLEGITWPDTADFAATPLFEVRNDSGRPLLFLSWLESVQNYYESPPDSHGNPWLDNTIIGGEPTVRVYDISDPGSPAELQSIDASLLPNEAEAETAFPPPAYPPPVASNTLCLAESQAITQTWTVQQVPYFSGTTAVKTFGVSDIYEDPLLGGQPVYLIHVPWANATAPNVPAAPMRGFYRIPVDMSDTFDFLDGVRQYGFTILPSSTPNPLSADHFTNSRFFSDPDNVWVPAPALGDAVTGGTSGQWFDRICNGIWENISQAETPGTFVFTDFTVALAACPGFHYDPVGDSFSFVAPVLGSTPTDLFAVVQLFICRGCRTCTCGVGVHIAHRV